MNNSPTKTCLYLGPPLFVSDLVLVFDVQVQKVAAR